MRNRKLVIALAVPVCVVLSYAAFALNTPAKNAKPAAKPTAKAVAKPAAKPVVKTVAKPTTKPVAAAAKSTSGKFNQKAVMDGFWSGPDTAAVGTVDGIPVTKGETIKALWNTTAPDMVNQLLDQKMLANDSKKQHAELTKKELDDQIKDILTRTKSKSVDDILIQYKITRERFDVSVRLQAMATKLALKNSPIKDDEFAQYVKARHILVMFDRTITDKTQQEEAAKKKIDAIDARLKAGEDFAKVATEVSEDPGSKGKGGDLGWFKRGGGMVQEFENAAFSLKNGQVSEPIKSSFGYHIIKVEGIGKDAVGAEKAQLRKMINDERAPMLVNQYVMQLKSKCKIVNKLAPPAPPMMVPGAMTPPSSGPRPGSPRMVAPRTPTTPAPPAPSGDKPTTPPPPPPPAE